MFSEQAINAQPGFWQKRWVQNVLPFLTSLWFHAGVIGFAVLTMVVVPILPGPKGKVSIDQPFIPVVSTVLDKGELGGPRNPGLGDDPNREMRQLNDKDVSPDSDGTFDQRGNGPLTLGASAGTEAEAEAMLTVGLQESIRRKAARGPGSGPERAGGTLAPFGVPGGGERPGINGNFMGSGDGSQVFQGATSVAYVCDASGSMLGQQFDLLRSEIQKHVDGLMPVIAYDVVFFQDESCAALSTALKSSSLLMATSENKRKTEGFLNQIGTVAGTNPIPALKHAMKMRPQLIFLLTDGSFDNPSNAEVIAEVRKMNADKKVKINTIAFYRQGIADNERKLCDEVLGTIAKENGGRFRVVMTTDLLGR